MKYRVKEKYKDLPVLINKVGKDRVNIAGTELKHIIEKTDRTPQREFVIRAATQEDLEFLYNKGIVYIEQIEDGEKPKALSPAEEAKALEAENAKKAKDKDKLV